MRSLAITSLSHAVGSAIKRRVGTDAPTVSRHHGFVLLVNLAGAAWLSARFLTGRSRLHRLERWQTTYLPVFGLWAAAVVVVLPLPFALD
jgi:hypothetical protein